MVEFICDKKKGGCGFIVKCDENIIKDIKTIQCPNCNKFWANPLYEGGGENPEYIS